MKRHKKPYQRRGGIGLPAAVTLFLAASLLIFAKFGGEDAMQSVIQKLSRNSDFITKAVALEIGIFPSESQIYIPKTTSSALYEDAEDPVSESTFIPTENSNPVFSAADKAATITINNETSYDVNVASCLSAGSSLSLEKSDEPQVLIVHTHGTESYTPDANFPYTPTESERTTDPRYSVIRVGDELTSILEQNGIKTIHCKDLFDSPAYSGSYDRALAAINQTLEQYPSIQVVIDLHRDSILTEKGAPYKTSYTHDGTEMAQLMFVVGTNDGGLSHDNWNENLNNIASLQYALNRTYSGLMRPINLRTQRFNQHARAGSMLVEVGSSGNTLTEAINSIRLFGEVLSKELAGA